MGEVASLTQDVPSGLGLVGPALNLGNPALKGGGA